MGSPNLHSMPHSVAHFLPFLRRHARMMLGRQHEADEAVGRALEVFAVESDTELDLQTAVFRALYEVLKPQIGVDEAGLNSPGREQQADKRLRAMSWAHRSVLLLTAVEGLSDKAVAHVLSRSAAEIAKLVDEAQTDVERELETSVLIIEDEWTIAQDLRRIVSDLGHKVAGMAATREDAIACASSNRPGLVLADINLADGSSGIDAVNDIFEGGAAPTIFITAFPERLLTGKRPEPTYLISKPYSPQMIQATVSQALFFSNSLRA